MKSTSLTYKTLRNSTYLLVGFVLPMLFTIFVTRELNNRLGIAEFGVFLLVNTISAFVGYVDLGLTTAITKYVAEYQAVGNTRALRNLLSSGRVIFIFTGIVGWFIFAIIGKWFLPWFNLSDSSIPHIFIVFVLAGLVFFFNSLNSVHNSILNATQRFDIITKIGLVNLVLVSLGTIAVLRIGFSLKAVMSLNVFSAFLVWILYIYFAKKSMPEASNLGFFIDKVEIKKAYRFGVLTFVSNLAGNCLAYLDRLIIPIFLGPAQLAFYSVPGNVALKTAGITNSLSGMLIPMSSALSGNGDMETLKSVYVRIFRNLSVVAAAFTLAIILFAEKILYFWLGMEYAKQGTEILIILAITYYVVALFQPLQSILLGLGKLNFLVKQSVFMAILNLALLFLLVPSYGIKGAAWAYLVSVISMVYAFYWVEKNVFVFNFRWKYYLFLYLKLIITAIVTAIIIYFGLLPLATSVWVLIIVGPSAVLLYFLIYYIFRFSDTEDETVFKNFIYQFFKIK
jgi:O-antigen/teichoic acid export membrane protein